MRVWPRGGLWRHADFLKLWSAETVSQLGTQVSQLALPLAAILVLDASAFQVAFLTTVEFLPFVLLTLPAGVWVDRLRRRPILVVADVGRATLLATIPVAYALDSLSIWQLYVVGFGVGACTVFFDVSYQSYLPSLVDRDRLVEGSSKLEISRSGALIAGPGIAGALVGALTAPYAIVVDAVSFLASAGFLFRIRAREERPRRTASPSLGRELVVYNVTGISLVQTLTPERLLGRLNASRRFIVWGTIPLGALVGGVLATTIGLRPTLWVGPSTRVSASYPSCCHLSALFARCQPSKSLIRRRLSLRYHLRSPA